MTNNKLIEDYNYQRFLPNDVLRSYLADGRLDDYAPWENNIQDVGRAMELRFGQSPALGAPAPDFPLWDLEGNETTLSAIWEAHTYTVVEFGSFT